ncbi:leucine-rich repeat flightless-interacting protein 1 isoform X2 [Sardina pilchardus]|uniref:leucine-rich repeat flightless-interacting protein 1 isoform X2 n=1 Tax=Sardina pilchardus TaxID=27697 RepID=UPI002E0D5483
MGTQGPGRKRIPNKERLTAEDDALNVIAREAEARLAAKRAARAEAREIRMKELERQQKENSDDEERMSVSSRGSVRVDDRLDRDYLEKGSRASTLSSATLASLGGTSSRRGSGDTSITAETETSIREIKDTLTEMEEKYRKAMVSNAQLDNEKCNLMYQVDIQKDSLMELEELLFETRREYEEKFKELEREKHAHSILQFQFSELKQTLKQSEELLTKHGIVLGPDFSTNGETGESGDGTGPADSDAKTSPTEGSSVLGRSEEKRPGVVEAAEGLQPNQPDEAVPQNHVTPPSPSGPASVVETCQSEEPGAPPIGNKEEIKSGNTINTELNNPCNDTVESVKMASVVNAGAEDEVTREEKASLEASGSSVERCKPPGEVEEMGNSEIAGLDPKAENQLVQKVEEVCAGEPAAEISEDVEEISVTDKSENAKVVETGEGTTPVPEIIVSIDTSDQSEEKPSEGVADLSSSCTVVAEEEASHPPKTEAEAEAAPVSEEEAEASQTPVKSQESQGTSASGKKKKRKRKGKQKQKGGAQSDVKQDNKDSKAQGESSLSKDPGQESGKENSGGKAAGSCVESIQQSPVCGEDDSTAEKRPLADTKDDAASGESENMPCLQASDNKDEIRDEPALVSSGDRATEISEVHPNPESENREHPSSDLEQSPVCGEADSTVDERPLADTKDDAASEELENVPCLQASDNKDDIRHEPTPVNSGDSPTETPEAHPNPESDHTEHPSSDLESGPNTDSVPGDTDGSPEDKDLTDGTEHNLCEDKDDSAPKVTGDEQNDEVVQSKKIDEQESTEISVDASESIVNTDVSESCQDQQVQVESLPCDTPIDEQQPTDTESQLTESKLNVEHQALGDLSEDTHASDSLDNELAEEKPEGSSAVLMDSSDAPSQLDGSESTETDQAESTLHSTENGTSQDDTRESLPDTGENGTETQPDEAEKAIDACAQSGEVVQPMASTDEESEPVIQDQLVATASSEDHPREASPETSDPAPKSKAEDDEEDDEGEEFQFEDQDLELLPDSPRQPLTEETKGNSCSKTEVNEEGRQGQDQDNNGSQEQSSVEQQEGGGKAEDEELETGQEPKVLGEEGSVGEEPKTEEADQGESSGMDHTPANPEHPLSSTEVEADAAEKGEAGSISGDSEGAGQVAEVESSRQGEPTRKDSKKGKKNKGKGKEDCKMS